MRIAIIRNEDDQPMYTVSVAKIDGNGILRADHPAAERAILLHTKIMVSTRTRMLDMTAGARRSSLIPCSIELLNVVLPPCSQSQMMPPD